MLSEHLGEVVVAAAGVGGRGERHHAGDNGSVDGVGGRPAAAPVRERGGTVGAVRGEKAAHLTFGDAEQAGGLGDRDGGAEEVIQNRRRRCSEVLKVILSFMGWTESLDSWPGQIR